MCMHTRFGAYDHHKGISATFIAPHKERDAFDKEREGWECEQGEEPHLRQQAAG